MIRTMHRNKYDICNGGVTIKGYSEQKIVFLITNINEHWKDEIEYLEPFERSGTGI